MKTKHTFYMSLLVGLLSTFCLTDIYGQNTPVSVTVSGIKSGKGQLVLSVFKDSESYDKEKAFKKFQFDKKSLANGTIILKCALETGTYGITILDDENANGNMDKNFIGIPKEGFGFSNFYMEKLKKPTFDDFKIQLKNENTKVEIKVKYL